MQVDSNRAMLTTAVEWQRRSAAHDRERFTIVPAEITAAPVHPMSQPV